MSFPSSRWHLPIVLCVTATIAVVSPRPYAGGWNDGSRLATIEALVDHHTFAIDESIFVKPPPDGRTYPKFDGQLREHGTSDKLLIDGKYYTDKPPIPAVLAAGVYWLAQRLTGLSAVEHTATFCWLMTFVNSGISYMIAAVCILHICRLVRLSDPTALFLTLAFAVASFVLSYTRCVNSHIVLLGIMAAMLPPMLRWSEQPPRQVPVWRLLGLGALAGLAYVTESGAGPVVVFGLGGWVLFRCWRFERWPARLAGMALFGLSSLPWFLAHHAVTYAVAGTFMPPNMNPDYLAWPGSPFTAQNMTGRWQHASAFAFIGYFLDLLVGQKGFYSNSLMLFVIWVGCPRLLRRGLPDRPELLCGLFWMTGIVLLYAVNSNNYSGNCVGVRWFVPLLAPAFFGLAVVLRERPELRGGCWVLCVWSLLYALASWVVGPWWRPPVTMVWIIMAGGLAHWAIHEWRRQRKIVKYAHSELRSAA